MLTFTSQMSLCKNGIPIDAVTVPSCWIRVGHEFNTNVDFIKREHIVTKTERKQLSQEELRNRSKVATL